MSTSRESVKSPGGPRPPGIPVNCSVEDLLPHPAYARHQLAVSSAQMSALAEKGSFSLSEPLTITHNRIVIDGYARLELAKKQGVVVLPCIQFELTESEALRWLLQRHRRSNGMNAYVRILLALELEPYFRQQALAHQRAGGRQKDLSNLAKADRLDVRAKIASAAGVSAGNVSKVRHLIETAHPAVLQAVQIGDVSIHRAWLWCKRLQTEQLQMLARYKADKGTKATIRKLVAQQRAKKFSAAPIELQDIVRRLANWDECRKEPVRVVVTKTSGKIVFITEDLLRALQSQEEFPFTCATKNL